MLSGPMWHRCFQNCRKWACEMNKSEKKWIDANLKASVTGRWAETMCKALGMRVASRWRFVSFRGKKGGEWRGIVDILAIRKDTSEPLKNGLKRGDLFEIMIVQIKGGKARLPSPSDIQRLKLMSQWPARKIGTKLLPLIISAFSLRSGPLRPLTTAFRLLPTAYCLLPTAYCLLPTAYCLPVSEQPFKNCYKIQVLV